MHSLINLYKIRMDLILKNQKEVQMANATLVVTNYCCS